MSVATPHAKVGDRLGRIAKSIAVRKDFESCLENLVAGQLTSFDEVWGSSCALLAASIVATGRKVLVVTRDIKVQDDLYDDLETWQFNIGSGPKAAKLPTITTISGSPRLSVDQEYGDRLRLLKRISGGDQPSLVVASVQSLLQPVPNAELLKQDARLIRQGQRLDVASFTAWLESHGFHRTTAVDLPGEFSFRGGILDVYAPDWLQPVRVELFDDEVESLRHFDLQTQRSSADVVQIELTVIDPMARHVDHFASYLADGTIVLELEPNEVNEQTAQYIERFSDPSQLITSDTHRRSLGRLAMAAVERLSQGQFPNHWRLQAESIGEFGGDMAELRTELDRIGKDFDVYVIARVEGELERIQEILSTTKTMRSGRLHLGVGCVHHAYRLRDEKVCVIGCDQMFHRGELRRGKARRQGKAIDSFLSLRDGDLIVHLAHGIGRFRGLKMLHREGQNTEHLELEFHGGTRIYVPATRIDLVQKYVGGT